LPSVKHSHENLSSLRTSLDDQEQAKPVTDQSLPKVADMEKSSQEKRAKKLASNITHVTLDPKFLQGGGMLANMKPLMTPPQRLMGFQSEFEFFLNFLWSRQDPTTIDYTAQSPINSPAGANSPKEEKVFGVPLNFNFMIPETICVK
jgi:hypothetical protein